jgi:hypothetical protein
LQDQANIVQIAFMNAGLLLESSGDHWRMPPCGRHLGVGAASFEEHYHNPGWHPLFLSDPQDTYVCRAKSL